MAEKKGFHEIIDAAMTKSYLNMALYALLRRAGERVPDDKYVNVELATVDTDAKTMTVTYTLGSYPKDEEEEEEG